VQRRSLAHSDDPVAASATVDCQRPAPVIGDLEH
jgi:hypothetical protein